MKLIVFFSFFYFFILNGFAKIYNCSNNIVPLKYGEIAFFQLGNYPAISPIEDFIPCSLNFTLNEENSDDFRLLYHFVELYHHYPDYNYHSKNAIIFNQLKFFTPIIPYMIGAFAITQQGYVVFEKNDKNVCPLASVSEGSPPYELKDETQIITLTNFFDQNGKMDEYVFFSKCNWKFRGPKEYGFKIWVNEFVFETSSDNFIVKNSTSVFLNHRTIESQLTKKSLHPIFNIDNYIEISFLSSNNFTSSKLNISISLVKKQPEIIPLNCYLAKQNATKYSSHKWGINYNYGYANNGNCKYHFVLPSNNLLYVQHGERLLLDTVGDIIWVKIGEDEEERAVTNTGQIFLDVGPFEKDINVTFEFKSDGSFQGLGFQLLIDIYECKCNTENVPCNREKTHFYMETSETYCNNLACNFTFLPCETEKSMVTFYETSTFFEVFKVYSDDEVVFDLNGYHEYASNYMTIFQSSAKNILEVIPLAFDNYDHEQKIQPIGSQRRFMFNLFRTPYQEPTLSITFSSNFSTDLIDMGQFKMAYFEVSKELMEQNLTFTIFVSDLIFIDISYEIQIFDNINLTHTLLGTNCFDDTNPYICKLKRNEFVAVQRYFTRKFSPYIAVQLSEKSNKCVFTDTVFLITKYGPGAIKKLLNISQIASKSEKCDITLLVDLSYDDSVINDNHFYISSIFTTAKNENVKIFFGNKNQSNLFIEFNHETASKWRYLSLNSKGYTIEIPKSASLLIVIERSNNYIPTQNFPSLSFESLVTTPYYAGVTYPYYNSTYNVNYHLYYFWGTNCEREVTFTVKYFNDFHEEELYFLIDDTEKLRIYYSGEAITFKKNEKTNSSVTFFDNIKLIYQYHRAKPWPPKLDNGAIFHIQYPAINI